MTLSAGPPQSVTVGKVTVQVFPDRFEWECPLHAVDADGAPNTYSLDPHLPALDYLANARHDPHDDTSPYVGVYCTDKAKLHPYVQPDGPYAGYLVSTTSLVDSSKAPEDVARYVDSRSVPYIVVPSLALHLGVELGDAGYVVDLATGTRVYFVAADVGPHLGEASIALAEGLGVNASPKHGGDEARSFKWTVFDKSTKEWPRSNADVVAQVEGLLVA